MTTPQDPDDTGSPQNPYGAPIPPPQNPYGAPPPPPADPQAAPPPAYGEAPPPPAYGQPQQPAYGEAPPPPAYGQAQQPPAYGQPAFPAYPQGQQPDAQPSKAMAITALVLSFIGCLVIPPLVAIVLAVIVLRRGRDGRNHGKGMAIAAIIISIVTLAVSVVAVVALGLFVNGLTDPEDLSTGDCITASGLSDENADTVTTIRTVSCSDEHDGEVLATAKLTQQQADSFASDPSLTVCRDAVTSAGKAGLVTGDIVVTALSGPDPSAGDQVACVAYHDNGDQLTGRLG